MRKEVSKFLVAFFKKSSNKPGWYLGEPIWKTAQKAGLKSAVFFWPGSEELEKLPNYWMKYNSSTPFRHRIDTVIKWLKLPDDERPSLIQAYFEEPDISGHKHGPDSQAVHDALILMDGVINYLIRRLLEEKLMGCINLILLSDHGTDDIINDIISTMECQSGNSYIAYRKDLVPIRFHYAGSLRMGDVIIKGRPGVCIFQTDEKKESYNRLGDHGYDNRIASMRTIFIAIGPDIAQNRKINSFQNIELYNLFTSPNNGTNGTLFPVLRNPPALPITALDQQTDQCTDKIKIRKCNSSCDCPLMNENYFNCMTVFNSSIRASYQFTGELCSIQLCDAIIHFDKKLQKTVIIEDHYYTLDLARVIVPKIFVDRIWRYVLNETAKYLAKYDKLRFFSGVMYDQDGDGVRDSDDIIK
uniref:Bm9475 n=1 Tax=Brugia malayi TaxID=6279 RepID=A0A1I9GCY2_BRUMA|nr:Bm9475 [Brugia malayi]